jgi:hypothetical protein
MTPMRCGQNGDAIESAPTAEQGVAALGGARSAVSSWL